MDKKICTTCKTEKEINDFHKDKKGRFGLMSKCKTCNNNDAKKYRVENQGKVKKTQKKYRENNIEKIKEWRKNNKDKIKEYHESNKEKIKERNKKWCKNNPVKVKEKRDKYYKNNKEKSKDRNNLWKVKNPTYQKEYYEKNKEKIKEKARKYVNQKIKNDTLCKLKFNIRATIYISLKRKNYTKKSRTHEILGCNYVFFKQYIESQFEDWMTWDNWGFYNGELNYGWDLDHIIPLSSAKTEEDIIKLNHYTNLQPLCSKINRHIKKDKI